MTLCILLPSALVLVACAPADKSGKFSIALGQALRLNRPTQIDLAKIEGPVWDEIFIFAPQSSRDDNCKILELAWLECRTTLPTAVADGENFIVFRTKGRISSAQRHAQTHGEFAMPNLRNYEIAPRSSAVFSVEQVATANDQGAPRFRLKRVE